MSPGSPAHLGPPFLDPASTPFPATGSSSAADDPPGDEQDQSLAFTFHEPVAFSTAGDSASVGTVVEHMNKLPLSSELAYGLGSVSVDLPAVGSQCVPPYFGLDSSINAGHAASEAVDGNPTRAAEKGGRSNRLPKRRTLPQEPPADSPPPDSEQEDDADPVIARPPVR